MIHYRVSVPAPSTHRAHVVVELDAHADLVALNIPVWTPGSYLVREFSRYIGEMHVADAHSGEALDVQRTAKGRWEVRTRPGQRIRASYSAYCHELTVRTPHIDHTHAFFTGTNILPYADDRLAEPTRLVLEGPDGWGVFCPLASDGEAYLAPDYDTLADCPVEMGPHRVLHFDACGVPHRIILWGSHQVAVNESRLTSDFRAIVEHNAAIFGGLPYANYDFIIHITAEGRGGLEHLNSTVLATPWRYFDTDDGYRELLGLTAHEHFHVWNVKRIKPASLVPFRYDRENYTRGLWVSEGFTTYFDDLVCARAGLYTREQFVETLRERVQRLAEVPGRLVQTLANASFDAWIRLYRPDDDTPFRTVSYYLKGSVVALGLDLLIRSQTRGERSLDDVMRLLWTQWRASGEGFAEDSIPAAILEATGVDAAGPIQRWVHTTEDIDLTELLATHALRLELVAEQPIGFGWDLGHGNEPALRFVHPGSPAEAAGLAPGDTLVALNGRRATADTISGVTARLQPGEQVRVHAFRRAELREFVVTPEAQPRRKFKLSVSDEASDEAQRLLEAWLTSPAPQ